MKLAKFFPLILLVTQASALIPGAWEPFPTEANADAWTLFDYQDGEIYYAPWIDEADPFVGSSLQDFGVLFYADDAVGPGAFTGDYAAAGVVSISVDVNLEDPAVIDSVDVEVVTEVGGEELFYYSTAYFPSTDAFFTDPGWYLLEFWFDEPWWDSAAEEWLDVLPVAVLSHVIEIGVTVFPVAENTTLTFVGIDNVSLNHDLFAPELTADTASGTVMLSFQPEPVHIYSLEEFDAATGSWTAVPGQTDILGPDPFVFAFPAAGGGLFRGVAEPYYTEVVSPPLR